MPVDVVVAALLFIIGCDEKPRSLSSLHNDDEDVVEGDDFGRVEAFFVTSSCLRCCCVCRFCCCRCGGIGLDLYGTTFLLSLLLL
jgi:hypothetical protein